MDDKFAKLREELPYKWKVQAVSKHKPTATCVAYIDARDAMEKLDQAIGPDKWKDEYFILDGVLFCRVSIWNSELGCWVGKTDCGVESSQEKEKGEASDAFKRACVKWGVGRFLYSLGTEFVTTNEANKGSNHPYPVDDNGKRLWSVTDHINNRKKSGGAKPKPKPAPKKESAQKDLKEERIRDIQKLLALKGEKLNGVWIPRVTELVKKCGVENLKDVPVDKYEELLSELKHEVDSL